jgi:hypothetical protein
VRTAAWKQVFCCLCSFMAVRSNEDVISRRISQTDIRRQALPGRQSRFDESWRMANQDFLRQFFSILGQYLIWLTQTGVNSGYM